MSELLDRIDRLNEIGIALSAQSDTPKLLELIMLGAKSLTNADGGSLYFLREGKLSFEIISNDSLDIQMGGSSGNMKSLFRQIPLIVGGAGKPQECSHPLCALGREPSTLPTPITKMVSILQALRETLISKTGYRTQSMLTFPLKNHEQETHRGPATH